MKSLKTWIIPVLLVVGVGAFVLAGGHELIKNEGQKQDWCITHGYSDTYQAYGGTLCVDGENRLVVPGKGYAHR
jgi:hypothetical protein